MELNVLRITAATGLRLAGATLAAGTVSLLFYLAFDEAFDGDPKGSTVLIKPSLTEAEASALQTQCATETPPEGLTAEAFSALCAQVETLDNRGND